MKKNALRELIKAGKPSISTRMNTIEPRIVETIGRTGAVDFIEFLEEYSSWTIPALDEFARAVELYPHMSSMIKIEREPRLFIAQRALGAGIQNVLFADCDNAEQAKECVSIVRPGMPQYGGQHGASSRRAYFMEGGSDAWIQAQCDVVVELMIESQHAIDSLEEILSVEGVDMVHFGPVDYTLSLGKPWKGSTPELKEIEKRIINVCVKKGVRYRCLVKNPEEAKPFIQMGVKDFCYRNDLEIIYNTCKTGAEKLRDILT